MYDASNNRMGFRGAVHMNAAAEGRDSNAVAFHFSLFLTPGKGRELLLGTNALAKLGVRTCRSLAEMKVQGNFVKQ